MTTDDQRPLDVDGPRPAFAWVSSLPKHWTDSGQRVVLMALAADSFDGIDCRPRPVDLELWTGLHRSPLYRAIERLEQVMTFDNHPETRPPLLVRVQDPGQRNRRFILQTHVTYASRVSLSEGHSELSTESRESTSQGHSLSLSQGQSGTEDLSTETQESLSQGHPGVHLTGTVDARQSHDSPTTVPLTGTHPYPYPPTTTSAVDLRKQGTTVPLCDICHQPDSVHGGSIPAFADHDFEEPR
jgi:hypothetical protein